MSRFVIKSRTSNLLKVRTGILRMSIKNWKLMAVILTSWKRNWYWKWLIKGQMFLCNVCRKWKPDTRRHCSR